MRKLVVGGSLLVLLVAAAAPAAAGIIPVGDPSQLNAVRCVQDHPEVAPLAGGGFIAVWIGSLGGGFEQASIIGRLLDAAGQPLGDELLLGEADNGFFPFAVQVAAGAEGGFVVAWTGSDIVEFRSFIRAFDAAGLPTTEAVELPGFAEVFFLALATDDAGRPAVAWAANSSGRTMVQRFEADLTPRGAPIPVADAGPNHGLGGRVAVAAQPSGELLVAWEERLNLEPPPGYADTVRVRRIDPDGTPLGEAITLNQAPSVQAPAVAALAGGGWAVTWVMAPVAGDTWRAIGQKLDAAGVLVGDNFEAQVTNLYQADDSKVVADPLGGFVVLWWGSLLGTVTDPDPDPIPPHPPVVFARPFGPGGLPIGPEVEVASPSMEGRLLTFGAAALAGSRLVVVWRDYYDPGPGPLPPFPCLADSIIAARIYFLTCASSTRLCLHHGRFAVDVRLPDAQPPHDPVAHAVPLTDDAGTFWFFREANVELMVKVLDGRPVNDHFWVFAGAMSNVHYEIDVTDTITGTTRTYPNPQGRLASLADTEAFTDPSVPEPVPQSSPAETGLSTAVARAMTPLPAPTHPIPSCDSAGVLCLRGGQFQAQISWHDPRSGSTGFGFAENLTDESGYFWFFRPGNAELVTKVLDGTTINGHYWVFFGGLTDVEFSLSVEDIAHHTGWSYHNPPYTLTSHADVGALPEAPPGPP